MKKSIVWILVGCLVLGLLYLGKEPINEYVERNKNLKAFGDDAYYELDALSSGNHFDEDCTYVGGAYYDKLRVDDVTISPEGNNGLIVYKLDLSTKLDKLTDIKALLNVKILVNGDVIETEKFHLNESGKIIYLCAEIPREQYDKKEVDVRAVADFFGKTYRLNSDYYSYDKFFSSTRKWVARVNELYKYDYDMFEKVSGEISKGIYSSGQLKELAQYVKDIYKEKYLDDINNNILELSIKDSVPETVKEDYNYWIKTVTDYVNCLEELDYSTVSGIQEYALGISYALIDLTASESGMGFDTSDLLNQ